VAGVLVNEVDALDDIDGKIIQALQIDPRAGFSAIGDVLGVSEQTVARRFRRLRADGLLRVIGLVSLRHLGQSEWVVRVTCQPGGTGPLAEALARRDDVAWVTLTAGGSEIVCSVQSRSEEQRDDLLQRLPATSRVLGLTAHELLHRYVGASSDDWAGFTGERLTHAQVAALRPPAEAAAAGDSDGEPVTLRSEDGPLLTELAGDGRCSYAALAAATGWSQGRATRRLAALRRAGILYFDLDLAMPLLGFPTSAYLWLTVEPASLVAVGTELARHDEVPFAAAVTGAANLVATITCRTTEALYQYVTTKIAATAGVRQLEVSPVLRRVKQAGSRTIGHRLAPPAPRSAASPRRARVTR
jgi:DNA-binding Lrp family transcriptional regulator